MERLAINGGTPVRKDKLFYGKQWIDEVDVKSVQEVLTSDFITCGPKIGELEQTLADYTGAKYTVAVSNGTAALHCACLAAGIGPGDEVITTPLTFAALTFSSNLACVFSSIVVFPSFLREMIPFYFLP